MGQATPKKFSTCAGTTPGTGLPNTPGAVNSAVPLTKSILNLLALKRQTTTLKLNYIYELGTLSLFNELKRRNVFRVGAAYIVTTWIIIQVVETLFPVFEFSNESIRLVVLTLAIGLLPVLLFSWVFEVTRDGLKREKNIQQSQSITHHTGKKLDGLIIFLLAIALAFFMFDKFVLDPTRDASMLEAAAQDAVQSFQNQTPDKSIAVLPFVNMSSDPEQEFFSDGLSEELLNLLAGVNKLRVAARTSSFFYKDKLDTVTFSEVARGAVTTRSMPPRACRVRSCAPAVPVRCRR